MADPNKSFREAHRAAELVGSVDSKRALAEEYVDTRRLCRRSRDLSRHRRRPVQGRSSAADGPGARTVPERRSGAARRPASMHCRSPIRAFVSGEAHLLYARALEDQGKTDEALAEYRRLVPYFSGEEARARFAMLARQDRRHATRPAPSIRRSSSCSTARPRAIRRRRRNGAISPRSARSSGPRFYASARRARSIPRHVANRRIALSATARAPVAARPA